MRPWELCVRPTTVKLPCHGFGIYPCIAPTRQRADLAPAGGTLCHRGFSLPQALQQLGEIHRRRFPSFLFF